MMTSWKATQEWTIKTVPLLGFFAVCETDQTSVFAHNMPELFNLIKVIDDEINEGYILLEKTTYKNNNFKSFI